MKTFWLSTCFYPHVNMFHASYSESIINCNCTAALVILDRFGLFCCKISLYNFYQFIFRTLVYRSNTLGINIHTVLPGMITHNLSVVSKIQLQHVSLVIL